MSRYRYHWKDRHDALVKRESPWLARIEFTVLLGLTVAAIGAGTLSEIAKLF